MKDKEDMNRNMATATSQNPKSEPAGNTGIRSIMAAAMGLTSLGSPSPPDQEDTNKPSLSQSTLAAATNAPMAMPQVPGVEMTMPMNALPPMHGNHSTYFSNSMGYQDLPLPSQLKKFSSWPSSSLGPRASFDSHPRMPLDNFSAATGCHMTYNPYTSYPACNTGLSMHNMMSHQITSITSTKTFPETLFDIISNEENSHIISWLPHGKGFIINDKQRFARILLPMYFDGAKFTSFTRRLKRWNFVRVARGPEMGAYYNKNFMRDEPEMVQKIRYRMEDGQFDEDKKKSEDDKDIQAEKKVKSKGKEKVPKKPPAHDSPKAQANDQGVPVKIPGPGTKKTSYSENPQDYLHKISSDSLGSHPSISSISGYPNFVSPNTPNDSRMVDIEREMLIAQSMMNHEVSNGGNSAAYDFCRSSLSSHPYYNQASVAPRMFNGMDNAHGFNDIQDQGTNSSNLSSPTSAMKNVAMRNLQSRLAPPPFSGASEESMGNISQMSSRPNFPTKIAQDEGVTQNDLPMSHKEDNSGGRPVMMSRQEEKEFAEYLLLKRKSSNSFQ